MAKGMALGFTGTRHGMTPEQIKAVDFITMFDFDEVHHGDCVGADTDMHRIARANGQRVVGHPPSDPKLRAFNECDELRPEKPYLDRNHDIVDEADAVIATPGETTEVLRSGTWSTIRYAKEQKKPLAIVWPDGTVEGDI